jgi:hypothetical protein
MDQRALLTQRLLRSLRGKKKRRPEHPDAAVANAIVA